MQVTLITGTSTGIGQATALHLARQGYRVFASMRNPSQGAAALTDVALAERLPLEVLQLDVDDPISAVRAVEDVRQKAGQIDVLINNAGIGGGGSAEVARLRKPLKNTSGRSLKPTSSARCG